MSRSPERLTAAALAAVLFTGAWADPQPADTTAGVEDVAAAVEDVIAEVQSLDGSESESKQGRQVTVALTSDVLFAVDKWVLTPKARQRLGRLAARVKADSGGGVVRIEGHTDDQGTDSYNDALSLKRAQAVQEALRARLSGVTFEARGFGEGRPKVPNVVAGSPVEENRARNRRVEIVFTVKS